MTSQPQEQIHARQASLTLVALLQPLPTSRAVQEEEEEGPPTLHTTYVPVAGCRSTRAGSESWLTLADMNAATLACSETKLAHSA